MALLHQAELSEEEGNLVWMRYMRFVRRSESIPASRKLFMRARRWPLCGWQVCCPLGDPAARHV